MTLVEVRPERVVADVEYRRDLTMPWGMLHGGVTVGLADTCAGIAATANLAPGMRFLTVELKVNFLRPVTAGRIRASCTPISIGRTVMVFQVQVEDEAGKPTAFLTATQLVLPAERFEP
ncbi:MAG: PaaI family thioesterase [Ardenticatenaceae bacterium]|nr:PaaI family thioesterase [Ardenticatenaceae bacterium]